MKENPTHLIQDLIWGEKSPSTLAIAINLAITLIYLFPAVLLFPLEHYKLPTLAGLIFGNSVILIYAIVAQWILIQKTEKRFILAAAAVISSIFVPFIGFSILRFTPYTQPGFWLSTFLPMIAVENASLVAVFLSFLAQWTVIIVGGLIMTKQLKKAGESESKLLFLERQGSRF